MPLGRGWLTPLLDDSGSGTDGSVLDKDLLTDIADAVDTAQGGAYVFDVSSPEYGAVGDGVTDDTAAIQAAIDDARAVARGVAIGALDPAATVVFPLGKYAISHLDCTGVAGLYVKGAGPWGVILYANQQASSSKAVIDLTGSVGCWFSGIQVFAMDTDGTTPAVKPTCAFLIAATSAGGDSTAHRLDHCGSAGWFTAAALYGYGANDHVFIDCGFGQYELAQPTIFIGSENEASLSSLFQTIDSGTSIAGEWSFFGCEIHGANVAQAGIGSPATFATTLLYNAYSVRFYDGVHDSSGNYQVLFYGNDNEDILFCGVQIYSESGTAADDCFYTDNATCTRLTVVGCSLGHSAFSGTLLAGTGGGFPGVRLIGIGTTHISGEFAHFAGEQDKYFGTPAASIAAGGTKYLGAAGASATESEVRVPVHRAGKYVAMRSQTSGSPGGGQTYTVTLRVNDADSALTLTQTGTDIQGSDLAHQVSVSPGQWLSVKVVASGGANALTGVVVSLGFVPAN